MSATGSNGTTPPYVLLQDFEQLVETVEELRSTSIDDIRATNQRTLRLEQEQKLQTRILQGHSEALSKIGEAVIRIETKLALHDEKIDDVEDKADRASRPDETAHAIAQVFIEDKRDSIAARKDRRTAVWSFVGKASAWLFVGGGAALIVMALAKSCGVDLPTP